MVIQTAEIVPGEVTQEQWDTKLKATTEPLTNFGGVGICDADDLPESATKKWASETGATSDQTGAEVRDLIAALGDTEREILITSPAVGEYKVIGIHRNADGNLEYTYDDVPEV